ncbi:PP2C family protein-serine/threonine phosphatase, partial [Bacteroidota bacterium]
ILGIGIIISYVKIREQNLIREKRILEEKVQERTIEIRHKNDELARKNKDITDSIKYAKRIQDAILPMEGIFENTFILFMPKDIVSGDFFWMAKKDGKEIMAAIDCTGHGVPGAFVSFVGHNSLNKIVKEYDISQPSDILDKLNSEVTKTFNPQGEGVVNDGMDMSIICYDKEKNILEYAGAFNPMFLFRNGKLLEYKANRFSIGRSQKQMEKKFTNHSIKLQKGDTIYLFSDGYADQFGGPDNRKFMAKNFKDLLSEIQSLSMQEQKMQLESTIDKWKGKREQIDDILIIGRKFK